MPFEKVDHSTTQQHGGIGLGLAIVSRLTRLMGGKIAVESTEGKGTTVRVRLPLASSEDSFVPSDFALESVMLVMGDSEKGRRIEQHLHGASWPVFHAHSGHDALLDLYRAAIRGKPYRILLVASTAADSSLPELIAQHLRLTPEGRILLLHEGPCPPRDDWPAGVHGYLPLDFSVQQLSDVLTRSSPSPEARLTP